MGKLHPQRKHKDIFWKRYEPAILQREAVTNFDLLFFQD